MTAYRISNWDRLYETAETRKLKRLTWVPTRNKHDGLGYRLMVRETDRADLFCAWNLMLQIASKGEGKERGTLVRDGLGLTPEDLSMMTGFPQAIFSRAIPFFSSHKIGWLEAIRQISGDAPALPADAPAEGKGREGIEQKEEKEKKRVAVAPLWTCPESLNTERFKTAFDTFLKHRQQKRSPMTAIAITGALSKMEKLGEARAVAAIEHSIAAGYTGIFEPHEGNNGGRHGSDADKRRSEKLGREYAEPARPPPVIKL